jgi:parallel beta-helix repeat protein
MRLRLGLIGAIVAAGAAFAGTGASAATACDLVASPSGSDAGAGSVSSPFQSAQKLVDSLAAGQVGCLEAGTYRQDVTLHTSGITLTSYPGQTATVVGRMWVSRTADQATVSGLSLDGANAQNLPSPSVNANNVTFSNDDVTDDHTAICFDIGSDSYGTATGTVITRDRIHDCGVLPAQNHDHGIYLQAAYGTQISWNLIYRNADRGIQLYPDAQNTTIDHNIIDGNGENIDFSGDDGIASSNSDVYANVISDATIRNDVESWYPTGNPIGQNNQLHDNCLWGGAMGPVDSSGGGFTAAANTVADPGFANVSSGNYTMTSSSPCLAIAGDVASVISGSVTVAQATAATSNAAAASFAPERAASTAGSTPTGKQSVVRRQARTVTARIALVRPQRLMTRAARILRHRRRKHLSAALRWHHHRASHVRRRATRRHESSRRRHRARRR